MSTMVPPHDLEAERAVLGAPLLSPDAMREVGALDSEAFYRTAHRDIHRALLTMHGAGSPLDLLTLSDTIRTAGQLDDVGGVSYLAEIADSVPTAANVAYYVGIVRKKAALREALQHAMALTSRAYEASAQPGDLLADAEAITAALRAAVVVNGKLVERLSAVNLRLTSEATDARFSTGFSDLDYFLSGGFRAGEFVILGGRPSMGKSAMATQMVLRAAELYHVPCLVVSREMLNVAVSRRLVAQASKLPASQMRRGLVSAEHTYRFASTLARLHDLPVWLSDRAMTPTDIDRAVDQIGTVGLIVVDYLQLLHTGHRLESRARVEAVSAALKALTLKRQCVTIALSSLVRLHGKKPALDDLRESGAIEHDADTVLLLHRESVDADEGECFLAKQRDGCVGRVPLWFRNSWVGWESQTGERDEEPPPDYTETQRSLL